MTMDGHLKVVAILHIASNLLTLFAACVILLFTPALFAIPDGGAWVFGLIALFIAGIIMLTAVPGIIGGVGLLMYQSWARILLFIVAAFSLFNFPIGTAIGAYTFWVLLQDEAKQMLR